MQTSQCDGFISDRLSVSTFWKKNPAGNQGVLGAIRGDGSWVVDRDLTHA